MTDRPIIFSGPMVRALLDGRKTQTRRVLKLGGRLPGYIGPAGCQDDPTCWGWEMPDLGGYVTIEGDDKDHLPGWRNGWRDWQGAYAPGDRLYVREAWRTDAHFNDRKPSAVPPGEWIWFEAQDDVPFEPSAAGRLRPGMFMPRWASRITLTVTDVRVQRLQDIRYQDMIAEGIKTTDIHARRQRACLDGTGECGSVCRDSFQDLWNSLHGPDAWDANPWVVAVAFTVGQHNIDRPAP